MIALDLLAAVKSSESDLNDTATTGSVPYGQLCINEDSEILKCLEVRDLKQFIRTRSRYFNY